MEHLNNPPKISLAAARVNAEMDQNEAASALQVNVATLRNWEKGTTVPQYDKVMEISKLYNYPVDYIFFGKRSL